METRNSVILHPGEGKILEMMGRKLAFLATKEGTNGNWSLIEYTAPPHAPGPPPHYHKEMEEAFYVIEGTLTAMVNGTITEIGPGGFVSIPPYVVHTWENKQEKPLKVLLLMSPGGFENYFIEMDQLVKSLPEFPPKDMTAFIRLFARYDSWLPELPRT